MTAIVPWSGIMEITPFAGGMPPEPEVDSAEAPAVQPASLAGPAASLGQLVAAALDASAPGSAGSATTRQAEQSVLAQAVRQHLHNQVGDLPGPIPDAARALSGRDQVSYTPIQLPNVAEDEEEEPLQRNTLDGGGAPGGPGGDKISYTPITIPNTLDGAGAPGGPGGDKISYTPITIPNTLDGGDAPPGPGGGDPVRLK